jgi:PAS domain S-box-containing protein
VTLPRPVKLLIGAGAVVGIACVAIRVPEILRWHTSDLATALVIAGLTMIAERCSIPLPHGSETVNFALTDGIWAGALVLVSPSVLTVAVLLGVGLGQMLHRWSAYKIAYNVSQFLLGITAAELLFTALGGSSNAGDPMTWVAVLVAMSVAFAVNATSIVLVVSMVERRRFLEVFRLPLALNIFQWLGNMALGILGAVLWSERPVALVLLSAPVALAYVTYRRWVESIAERDQMRDLYEAGRALSVPLAPTEDFGDFLRLLERLLPADRVELVVVDDERVTVHASSGVRSLTVDEGESRPLEAFVSVRSGIAPQIALVGDGEDVRGVLAVYRTQPLMTKERLLLNGLAGQIAVRLRNHSLYGRTLERARLSEIVAHTTDGIFTVDQDGRITTWNPAMNALVGYTEEEALGRRCEDLLGLECAAAVACGDVSDTESRDVAVGSSRGLTTLRLRTSTIRDHEQAPRSRIVVVRDASEETRAEQIKRDFVSMVSHELRTPLTPLKGFLKSLLEGAIDDSPDARREYYRIMLRQTQRLERLVGDMLDASQIEAGGLVVDPEPVVLAPLLTHLVAEFREQHHDRDVRLRTDDGPLLALADPFRVEQVLLNLLTNADKYTAAGLPMEVYVMARGDAAVISVRDHGEGISPEHRDKIFDRFFRVDEGSGRRQPGTGLGLYIARTLVEAMSGHIWVESHVGVGSTFSFSVPLVDLGPTAVHVPGTTRSRVTVREGSLTLTN